MYARTRQWLWWLALPPPWWIVGSLLAFLVAVWLGMNASPWAPAVAVLYQVGGAVLAVWQFMSLHRELNSEWLTREVLEWWAKRPMRRHVVINVEPSSLSLSAPEGRVSVWPSADASHDEQLRIVWDKLKTLTSEVGQMRQENNLEHEELTQRFERHQSAALAAAEDTKFRLSSALTSAPLMAVFGLWLILVGLGMQLWLAIPAFL